MKYQRGDTLLEVLITIVIFSIALLGVSALQLASMRIKNDSSLRTTAAHLAADMADRMRANITATEGGAGSAYNNPNGASTANPNCLGVDSSGTAVQATCSPAQMAAHDFYEWNAMISGQAATGWHPTIPVGLPNGTGIVCVDSTPFTGNPTAGNPQCDNTVAVNGTTVFAIKLFWDERSDADPNSGEVVTHRYIASFQP